MDAKIGSGKDSAAGLRRRRYGAPSLTYPSDPRGGAPSLHLLRTARPQAQQRLRA